MDTNHIIGGSLVISPGIFKRKMAEASPIIYFCCFKMDELDQEFDPAICTDSERYFENLVRRKKGIQKNERINYRRYLKMRCGQSEGL